MLRLLFLFLRLLFLTKEHAVKVFLSLRGFHDLTDLFIVQPHSFRLWLTLCKVLQCGNMRLWRLIGSKQRATLPIDVIHTCRLSRAVLWFFAPFAGANWLCTSQCLQKLPFTSGFASIVAKWRLLVKSCTILRIISSNIVDLNDNIFLLRCLQMGDCRRGGHLAAIFLLQD